MSTIVLICCITIVVLQILTDLKYKRFNLFDYKYIFEAYYIICLPLCNFLFDVFGLSYNDDRIKHLFVNIDRTRVSLYILLGFVSFALGHAICYKTSLNNKYICKMKNWKENRIIPILVFMLLSGYFGLAVLIHKMGGLIQHLSNIGYFRNSGLVGNGLWFYLCTDMLGMCFLVYLISQKKKSKALFVVLFILCIIPSFFLGFRSKVASILVKTLVVYGVFVKKIKIRWVLCFFIAMIGGLVAYGLIRDQGIGSHPLSEYSFIDKLLYSLLRTQGSEVFGVVLNDLDVTSDYQWGYRTVIEALTILIPRSIWPGKITPKSVIFSETFFGLNGGVSPTILTEFYWDFGTLGVVVGLILTGMFVSVAYNTLVVAKSNTAKILFAEIYYMIFLLVEAVSGTMNGIVIFMLFFTMIIGLLTI